MKKLMLIALLGLFIGSASYAQAVVVSVKPAPVLIRPLCPGPGHIWVSGMWRWDRRLRRSIWVEGYWSREPQRFHRYGRVRRF
ncbi:MAG TPA: hypothetical protein VIM65_13245 [Cyclobacteriaceae bacterium]